MELYMMGNMPITGAFVPDVEGASVGQCLDKAAACLRDGQIQATWLWLNKADSGVGTQYGGDRIRDNLTNAMDALRSGAIVSAWYWMRQVQADYEEMGRGIGQVRVTSDS